MLPALNCLQFYGGCVWDTFGCAGSVHDPHRLTNPNTVASCRLVTMWWLHLKHLRINKMKTWNQLPADRYRSLESNLTDTKPLIIDTTANPQDILECAVQRLRASSDLLKTLYCLSFKQADVEDIPHITHALYLLTQDGCDLLQVAQQQMLGWKAPV